MKLPTYERVSLANSDPRLVRMIEESKSLGRWVCDSLDHNDDTGCSNPACFKHPKEKL